MSYGHKLLANKTFSPNGSTQTLIAPPASGVIISRIVITPAWEPAENQGFVPSHYGNWVELYKQGEPYNGYNRVGGGQIKYRYNSDKPYGVLLTNKPQENYPTRMVIKEDSRGFAHVGAYSLFTMGINGNTITGVLDAPPAPEPLELSGPICLAQGQNLQVTNGIVLFPGHTLRGG